MTDTVAQLESIMKDCLAGKTPADAVTGLAYRLTPDDLTLLLPYLTDVPGPEGFFEVWPHKGRKTINDFYHMLDMFSALVYAQGEAGLARLAPYVGPRHLDLERVLALASDDRFNRDIVDTFLTGQADPAANDAESSALPEPVQVAEPMALMAGDAHWELSGELSLAVQTRLFESALQVTASLLVGLAPIDDARVYVRAVPKTEHPPAPTLDPDNTWIRAVCVEAVVEVDGTYWRSDAPPEGDPTEERPWFATFRADTAPPDDETALQIMIVDPAEWDASGTPVSLYHSTVVTHQHLPSGRVN